MNAFKNRNSRSQWEIYFRESEYPGNNSRHHKYKMDLVKMYFSVVNKLNILKYSMFQKFLFWTQGYFHSSLDLTQIYIFFYENDQQQELGRDPEK